MRSVNKSEYINIFRELFNEVDPLGIFHGENIEKYDSEIEELMNNSVDYRALNKLEAALRDIFSRFFEGILIDEIAVKKPALEISKRL